MMSEVILTITIMVLLIYIAVSQYLNIKEREKLMKMFIAKSLREVTDNEVLDKRPAPTDEPKVDMIPLSAEDEELFDKHIQAEIKAAQAEHDEE